MSQHIQRAGWVAAGMAAILGVTVLAQGGAQLGEFRVPEYDDDGIKKSEITGRSAQVNPQDGSVSINDFKIEFYEEDGEIRMEVTAPQCTYVPQGKVAKSESSVQIKGEKMIITGEEFAWDGQRELFKIFKNARVVIQTAGRDLGLAGTVTEEEPNEE